MRAIANEKLLDARGANLCCVMSGSPVAGDYIKEHLTALRNGELPHFRMYDLRHTWATRAAESGIDLLTIAALLGHSRIEMVKRYAHPTDGHKFKAIKRLEAYTQSLMNVQEQCTNMGTLVNQQLWAVFITY